MKISSVNPCGWANLFAGSRCVGQTVDTPNAIAYAMAIHPEIDRAVAEYPMFASEERKREDLANRFGWVVNDADFLGRWLIMFDEII